MAGHVEGHGLELPGLNRLNLLKPCGDCVFLMTFFDSKQASENVSTKKWLKNTLDLRPRHPIFGG
jgi:heme-degrading monooxygenase HmoA